MPDEIDELYSLPLDEFVSARNRLARGMRREGDREGGDAVAKLAKPSVAAWAANQALRSQPRDARALLAAADELDAAQRELLEGAEPRRLRDASESHHRALERLKDAAGGLLDSNGRALSAAVLDRVVETLRAASLEPGLRPEAQAARLTREHTYAGLGAGMPWPASASAKGKPSATKARSAERARLRAAQQKLDRAARDAERAAADDAAAASALDDAKRNRAATRRKLAHARDAQRRLEREVAKLEKSARAD